MESLEIPRRPMDDFLINPTATMTMNPAFPYNDQEASGNMPAALPYDIFTLKADNKTSEQTHSTHKMEDEPLFWPGYASEEELASPIDNDDFSFNSIDSDMESIASIGEASFHSLTQAQQLCSRAQAVQVVSAGKAKVVSMPKLIDAEGSPYCERPTTASENRPVNFSLRRSNNRSIGHVRIQSVTSSPRTSDDRRPAASSPILWTDYSDSKFESRRRRPLPLDLVPRSESPRELQSVPKTSSDIRDSPSPRTKNSLDYEQHHTQSGQTSSTTLKRRVYRLPAALNFRTFSKTLLSQNRSASVSTTASGASTPEHVPTYLKPRVMSPTVAPPARSLPKMVPRGANERAPLLILPPCPYEDDDDDAIHSEWPSGRRDRRKSLPAFAAASSEV